MKKKITNKIFFKFAVELIKQIQFNLKNINI